MSFWSVVKDITNGLISAQMIGLYRVIIALINLMDWKYDSTEAACIISAYLFRKLCLHLYSYARGVMLYIKNAELKKINNRGHLFSLPFSLSF